MQVRWTARLGANQHNQLAPVEISTVKVIDGDVTPFNLLALQKI
jgi:hypothetical protein